MYTKANLAALRVKKDIAEVGVSMTAGLYEGATFYFLLTIPPSYPFHAPSVVCTSRAWHPNIDLHTGFVSLPILMTDWRPVLSINTVVFALQLMFLEPSEQMPVNESAAAALANPELFREQVRSTLAGGFLFGVQFEPHRQGSGCGRGGGPGAAQKRKRGEGMDTEAVQTTLEAMRIQEDAHAEKSSAWDKRPRHQTKYFLALGQPPRDQPSPGSHQTGDIGSPRSLALPPPGFIEQHQRQAQAQSSPAPGCGAPPSSSQNYVGTSFDRPRFPDVQAEMPTAASVRFRCGVEQAGASQPTASGVGDGVTVGWDGGQFQAVPASSLQ